MAYEIVPLAAAHAAAAAAIHAEGQPNTFLTSLGPAFLRALYAEMAASEHCYGYVAVDGGDVVGVVTGTVDSGAVFKDLIWRHGFKLALPVLGALLRRPALIGNVFETLFYPSQAEGQDEAEAELFFIGARANRRGEGIGRALFDALVAASRRRGMSSMGLTVDDDNAAAQRFYRRLGMEPVYGLTLYGRPMHWYSLPMAVSDGEGIPCASEAQDTESLDPMSEVSRE